MINSPPAVPAGASAPIQRTGLDYSGFAAFRDEMTDGGAAPRPHWQPFVHALRELGVAELTRRWEEAKQIIRENGVTYNVYGDPRALDRPWQLDPVPLLISSDEAHRLEEGLVQRARLLDAILVDLYGPQRLLREGFIPAEIIYSHPGFLRPCHGVPVPANRYLYLYATDIGRGQDGAFHVIGDRTQAPSGAGYALENRIVLARMLPEIFRDCRVQRLALFFRTLRDTLRDIAPRNRDNPRIVLLTPGPYNETYFEHAYLARYLGYTLAEGGDLTVRDSRVYLKLLGGLQQVDVILRRLDDDYCDPLELRGDSFLGVPGLVQAVRAGNVAIANALGSGLVETPTLMPYLPAICRFLFNEELRLPSVNSWWCGDPQARDYVLNNLERLVIKPASAVKRFGPIFGDRLNREHRHALSERIRARPRDYVAQEQLPLATVPVFNGEHLEPRHAVLRTYLTASDDGFMMMPGGLTRVTASADTMVVSMQQGGGSKDTWVLSSAPVSSFTLLSATVKPVELSRGGSDLPSRAADNLFWLGRYVERAEGLVRLLRGILVRLLERSGVAEIPELPFLLRVLSLHSPPPSPMLETCAHQPYAELFVRDVLFDDDKLGSLMQTLRLLHRVAGMVRDRISTDMWRVVSGLKYPERPREIENRLLRNGAHPVERNGTGGVETLTDALDEMNRLIGGLAAFGGLAMESMTRGQGWRFLDMGRRLERSMHLVRLLHGTLVVVSPNEGPVLESLLEIADSAMTYRRRYLSSVQTAPVLDLLLADESNPRSLVFQLAALADDVDRLPRDPAQPGRSAEQRLTLAALSALQLIDIDLLASSTTDGVRHHLEELLMRLQREIPVISDTLTQNYLSHLQPSRHLAAPDQDK